VLKFFNNCYEYFGLQNGKECYGGNYVGRYGKAITKTLQILHIDLPTCNSKCPQRQINNCGGSWANSVFQINNSSGPEEPKWSYKGCYKDTSKRDLH